MRRSLLALTLGVIAVAVVGLVGLAWKDRADEVCREKAPARAGDYSVRWEWNELAYVCDYRAPEAKQRRVGIVDAFHGEGAERHRR